MPRPLLTDLDCQSVTRLLNLPTPSAAGDAAPKGYVDDVLGRYWGALRSDYTLTSNTSVQKLFNWSANGALALPTGVYRFQCGVLLTGMSGTSGNGNFSIAGTAGIANPFMQANGFDNTAPGTPAAAGESFITVQAMAFTGGMAPGTTGTALAFIVWGDFDVTTGGTVIPSFAMANAAAAIVEAGSYFIAERLGPTGQAMSSGWS